MSQPELEKKNIVFSLIWSHSRILKNFKYPVFSLVSDNPIKIYPSLIDAPAI